MSDNPHASQTPWFPLYDHRLVALSGRDALAFAQAQTMNDVAALADGRWHWNGWLTAKGRVIALFAVIRIDNDTLWLLVPDADADDLATRLRRFQFRSKLAIEVRDDLRVAGRLSASCLASGNHWVGSADEGIELDLSGRMDGGMPGRSLRIAPGLHPGANAALLARWRCMDLAHGLPRLDPSQSEQWTPQQLSLERLNAFSVKKGCYPGQEIVARTHFLGQAKRGLALVRGDAQLEPAMDLPIGEQVVGTVVSTCGDLGLAVLPRDLDADSPGMPGASWRFEPVYDGLAR
jgi:folate-binding protein YgfZ